MEQAVQRCSAGSRVQGGSGMQSSEQVKGQSCSTGKGTKPRGGRKVKGDALLERPGGCGTVLGPLPSSGGSTAGCEGRLVGGLGRAMLPAGWSEAAVSMLQGKGTSAVWDRTWTPSSVGWEGTLGADCRGREPKAAVLGGAGEEQRTLVLLTAGRAGGSPTAFCAGRAAAPWVGSQWFGGPKIWASESTPSLLCKAQLQAVLCPQQSVKLAPVCWEEIRE